MTPDLGNIEDPHSPSVANDTLGRLPNLLLSSQEYMAPAAYQGFASEPVEAMESVNGHTEMRFGPYNVLDMRIALKEQINRPEDAG